ncbi:helix-turn-helix domain-containing protein [Nocardia sp. NPDC004568]|uniref:helix-turn-helix domain-containing protein n=1 Tax=Nocardia sp. NPDC004568 TaxID=3154551 RepID=UPI0033A54D28
MARTGRPRSGPELVVTEAQRQELVRGARAATSTQAYALRCRIVLACAEPGVANAYVAAAVGVTPMTVAKWRRRFIEHGLPGLADEPRPGRPPSILLDRVEQVLAEAVRDDSPFRKVPLRRLGDVEALTAGWIAWYNQSRLMHRLGRKRPIEYEAEYYAQLTEQPVGNR